MGTESRKIQAEISGDRRAELIVVSGERHGRNLRAIGELRDAG
ncbi:MAG: hypothetical protein SOH48_00705 [Eubacteriales bacterium]